MKRVLSTVALVVLVLVVMYLQREPSTPAPSTSAPSTSAPSTSGPAGAHRDEPARDTPAAGLDVAGAAAVAQAFENKVSGVLVELEARVQRTLPDDNEGSRHQRFIVQLSNDMTLLVAHNIDLAPRVPLSRGDIVGLRGQYEWNDRGGVLHWTHHDPRGRHPGGWIRHEGALYE